MSFSKKMDKAIKALDVKGLEGMKFFEFTADIKNKKTGETDKNAKLHGAGGDMQKALSAVRTKFKMYGYDISVKDVKEVKESTSKSWIVNPM